jgi:hypothetical protein
MDNNLDNDHRLTISPDGCNGLILKNIIKDNNIKKITIRDDSVVIMEISNLLWEYNIESLKEEFLKYGYFEIILKDSELNDVSLMKNFGYLLEFLEMSTYDRDTKIVVIGRIDGRTYEV